MSRLLTPPLQQFDLHTLPVDDADLPCWPLSEWLEKALQDLTRCEQRPERYTVDMGEWHTQDIDGRHCLVCLAGSLLTWTFGLADDCTFTVLNRRCEKTYAHLLRALDELRGGNISEACFHAQYSPLIPDHIRRICETIAVQEDPELELDVTPYRSDPAQWRKDMEGVLRQLLDLGI